MTTTTKTEMAGTAWQTRDDLGEDDCWDCGAHHTLGCDTNEMIAVGRWVCGECGTANGPGSNDPRST